MQFSSTFSRLAAFALLFLSFTLLVHAAPAAKADGALVARTSPDDECQSALLTLKANIQAALPGVGECRSASLAAQALMGPLEDTCLATTGCDVVSLILTIIGYIDICVTALGALQGAVTLKLTVCINLCIEIVVVCIFLAPRAVAFGSLSCRNVFS